MICCFYMEETIFSKIIRREIPATIVYEDDHFIALLDINPVQKGHTLLVSKEPYVWMEDVPDAVLSEAFIVAKKIMQALKKSLGCDYVQVIVEGIQVPHFHIHLVPGMKAIENATWHHVSYVDDVEKNLYADKIKSALE